MKKISIALILSLLVMYVGYGGTIDYILLKKGAGLSSAKEYDKADEIYDRLAGGTFREEALRNKVINLYRAGRYREVTKTEGREYFIRGNSYVYLGDQSGEEGGENYKRALEEYKLAMEGSSDINIKKNYEIVMRKLKDHEQKQQEDQEKSKEKSRQDRDQMGQPGEQEQDKKDGNSDESQEDQGKQDMKDRSTQGDSSGDEGEPGGKMEDSSESGDGSDTGDPTSGKVGNEKGDLQRREAMTILKGLEGNESQAFKNNERLERALGGEEEDESW